jgi:hypothetical protein
MHREDPSDGATPRRFPHVERLPVPSLRPAGTSPDVPGDALADLVGRISDWRRRPVPLTWQVTGALWFLVLLVAGMCAGLVAVLRHPGVCDALWCRTATFGGHPRATLVVAAASLAAFAVLAALTRGLTRVNTRQLVAVVVSSAGAVTAVIGALVVIVVVVAGALLAGFALIALLVSMARTP